MKNFLLYTAIIIFISSCSKNDVTITKTIELPVVESYLIAGGPIKVTVSLPVGLNQDAATPTYIDSLQVKVYADGKLHLLTSLGQGIYMDTTVKVLEGSDYKLEFAYNNNTITAETIVPSKPQGLAASANTISIPTFGAGFPRSAANFPIPITLTWNNNDQGYYFVAAKCIESTLVSISSDTTGNRPQFSRAPTQENTASLRFNAFSYYGMYHVYLFKANPEYVALFKSSGTNSQNITNPPTNIQNGFGIFTSFGVDSVNVNVTQ